MHFTPLPAGIRLAVALYFALCGLLNERRPMQNLLVTGGSGFIGTNFIRYLLGNPDFSGRIINVDKLTYAGNPANLEDLTERHPNRYYFSHTDICDAPALSRICDEYQIDAICHFAAESHVDRSIACPDDFIQTNIVGTFNLLECARILGNRLHRFHHVSTDEVFGSLTDTGHFTEKTPYRPNSPYSASKAASDHLVRAYHKTYGLPITLSNCSNNYGPFQFPEKLIPLMILNALDGKPLPVYGSGKNVRDWLFVNDHCDAIWRVMQKGREGATYIIGGDNELENIHVVETICDILDQMKGTQKAGSRRRLIEFVKDRPGHDFRYAIDFSKIKAELGWVPSESFETGIKKTIHWYLDHRKWVRQVQSGEYRRWINQQYGN
jgi:dTDP-glucose 4,6-dehydratase